MIDAAVIDRLKTQTPEAIWWTDSPPPLVSYSLPWPGLEPLEFLRLGSNIPRIYWDSGKSPLRLAGLGAAASLTAHGADRFQVIRQQAGQLSEHMVNLTPDAPPEAAPRFFGGFAFSADDKPTDLWSAFPAARFILPHLQLSRWGSQQWLTITRPLDRTRSTAQLLRHIRQDIDALRGKSALATGPQPDSSYHEPPLVEPVMSQAVWEQLVADATRRIGQRDLEKVVLARARRMRLAQPIDPVTVLARLEQRYQDTYRFLVEPIPGHAFYGATPELLARVEGDSLHTVAMAGSIRRGATPQEDEALGRELFNSVKDRHEHALVVEAIQENLGSIVADLCISPAPELCRLSNIQHLETVIQGTLAKNQTLFDVVQGLHPTPAVGGRPRDIALEIIRDVEPTRRGWYAAPVGWFDGQGNGLFSVAIRSAVSVGCEALLYAGAGIVAKSVPETEWHETELKFKPMAQALGGDATHGRRQS